MLCEDFVQFGWRDARMPSYHGPRRTRAGLYELVDGGLDVIRSRHPAIIDVSVHLDSRRAIAPATYGTVTRRPLHQIEPSAIRTTPRLDDGAASIGPGSRRSRRVRFELCYRLVPITEGPCLLRWPPAA